MRLEKAKWRFFTNHGTVFIYIAKYPRATTRNIAQKIGITERAVQKVIRDLEAAGYVVRNREGRNNIYEINPDLPMRHPVIKDQAVGNLLLAVGCDPETINWGDA